MVMSRYTLSCCLGLSWCACVYRQAHFGSPIYFTFHISVLTSRYGSNAVGLRSMLLVLSAVEIGRPLLPPCRFDSVLEILLVSLVSTVSANRSTYHSPIDLAAKLLKTRPHIHFLRYNDTRPQGTPLQVAFYVMYVSWRWNNWPCDMCLMLILAMNASPTLAMVPKETRFFWWSTSVGNDDRGGAMPVIACGRRVKEVAVTADKCLSRSFCPCQVFEFQKLGQPQTPSWELW